MSLEAKLALEWLFASGERTVERLVALVDHFCNVNGVDNETRGAIHAQAKNELMQRQVDAAHRAFTTCNQVRG